jgi:hypothetical protein
VRVGGGEDTGKGQQGSDRNLVEMYAETFLKLLCCALHFEYNMGGQM